MNFIKLIKSKKSVFSINDIKIILNTNNSNTIRNYLTRQKHKWLLKNIWYWLWTLEDKEINTFELACKLKKISYISFETVLKKEWVIFQYYWDNIFLASNNSIKKKTIKKNFNFIKLKNSILLNPIWIIHKWTYQIASVERAICDRLYITKWYYFDNISQINFEKLEKISQIYNKRVILEVKKLIINAKSRKT